MNQFLQLEARSVVYAYIYIDNIGRVGCEFEAILDSEDS